MPQYRSNEMHSHAIVALLPSILCIAIGIWGCGRSDRLPTYTATGTVLFPDGRPLGGGTIIFESVNHPVTARATIGADGKFELGTYETGDGAVAGLHRIAISPPALMDFDPDEHTAPAVLHSRYTSPDTSGLEYTVDPDGPNQFQVEMEPP